MRVERLEERESVKVNMLDAGQCFQTGSSVFILTGDERYNKEKLACELMAVQLVSGAAMWFDIDTEVRPLYAKVVVEW